MRQTFHTLRRGDRVPSFAVTVTVNDVHDYLEATGETSERWRHAVPPLAIGALLLAGLMAEIDLPAGAVHVGQQFEFVGPVQHGETVDARLTIAQQGVRGGQNIVVFASEVMAGERVVVRGRTMVMAPATDEASA